MRNQTPARRNTRQEVIAATNEKITQFQAQVDQYAGHLMQALPRHVSIERFKRVLVTAASMNPDLLLADRRTLFLAAIKCASDGLMPDSRQAALVVYSTEIKRRDPQTGIDHKFRIDAVQYMPMVSGIRERMRNTGEVLSATAEIVCANDPVFDWRQGDDPLIRHVPAPLTEDRGEIVGAYAIIKLKNGEVLRDVMTRREIEQTRAVSRAKDGPMWTKFYGEAARKTVLRRCSKAAPQAADLDRLIGSEDEESLPALAELSTLPAPEPERVPEDEPPTFEVVGLDGEVFVCHDTKGAAEALRRLYEYAAKRGAQFLSGALETNAALQHQLEAAGERFEIPEPVEIRAEQPTTEGPPRRRARRDEPGVETTPPPPEKEPPPFPGDLPSRADRRPMEIAVPALSGGKPDYRGWALGLFLPKIRQMNASADYALLLGDNEQTIERARRTLSPADVAELNAEIDARWTEIEEIERQPAE